MPESAQVLPSIRPGAIPREQLLSRIGSSGADVVAVIAAPGYGKTTLLAEWTRRDPRPVAWLALDARDDDPAVLLSGLASAAPEPALWLGTTWTTSSRATAICPTRSETGSVAASG